MARSPQERLSVGLRIKTLMAEFAALRESFQQRRQEARACHQNTARLCDELSHVVDRTRRIVALSRERTGEEYFTNGCDWQSVGSGRDAPLKRPEPVFVRSR